MLSTAELPPKEDRNLALVISSSVAPALQAIGHLSPQINGGRDAQIVEGLSRQLTGAMDSLERATVAWDLALAVVDLNRILVLPREEFLRVCKILVGRTFDDADRGAMMMDEFGFGEHIAFYVGHPEIRVPLITAGILMGLSFEAELKYEAVRDGVRKMLKKGDKDGKEAFQALDSLKKYDGLRRRALEDSNRARRVTAAIDLLKVGDRDLVGSAEKVVQAMESIAGSSKRGTDARINELDELASIMAIQARKISADQSVVALEKVLEQQKLYVATADMNAVATLASLALALSEWIKLQTSGAVASLSQISTSGIDDIRRGQLELLAKIGCEPDLDLLKGGTDENGISN